MRLSGTGAVVIGVPVALVAWAASGSMVAAGILVALFVLIIGYLVTAPRS